jgi:hypothetical protein
MLEYMVETFRLSSTPQHIICDPLVSPQVKSPPAVRERKANPCGDVDVEDDLLECC